MTSPLSENYLSVKWRDSGSTNRAQLPLGYFPVWLRCEAGLPKVSTPFSLSPPAGSNLGYPPLRLSHSGLGTVCVIFSQAINFWSPGSSLEGGQFPLFLPQTKAVSAQELSSKQKVQRKDDFLANQRSSGIL